MTFLNIQLKYQFRIAVYFLLQFSFEKKTYQVYNILEHTLQKKSSHSRS